MDTEWFKIFCRDNRLRLSLDDDGLPVAKAIGKWSEDKFTEGYGDGVIGVVVIRETKNQFTHLKKRLVNKYGCIPARFAKYLTDSPNLKFCVFITKSKIFPCSDVAKQ